MRGGRHRDGIFSLPDELVTAGNRWLNLRIRNHRAGPKSRRSLYAEKMSFSHYEAPERNTMEQATNPQAVDAAVADDSTQAGATPALDEPGKPVTTESPDIITPDDANAVQDMAVITIKAYEQKVGRLHEDLRSEREMIKKLRSEVADHARSIEERDAELLELRTEALCSREQLTDDDAAALRLLPDFETRKVWALKLTRREPIKSPFSAGAAVQSNSGNRFEEMVRDPGIPTQNPSGKKRRFFGK